MALSMTILYEIFKMSKKITLIPLYDFDMTF